jgi:hypothetical protein
MTRHTSIVEMDDWVYLKLHKCASTSIMSALKSRGRQVGLCERTELKKKFFSVTRNPYSRLVSCWADRVVGNGWENSFGGGRAKSFGLKHKMPFVDFARMVCDLSDRDSDCHFASVSFLVDYFLGRPLDFFLKVECLSVEWATLGLGVEAPTVMKRSKHGPWASYYDSYPDLKGRVYDRYERDFVDFGYERLK